MSVDYADLAAAYDRARARPGETEALWLPVVTRLAGAARGCRVLDVGCGTGRFTIPFAGTHRVVGLDASPDMLRVAAAKGARVDWILGDTAHLPFRDGAFDVAIAVFVLHLLPHFRKAVREFARVSSRAVVATADIETRVRHAIDEAFPSLHGIDLRRFPAIGALETACREAGFREVEVRREKRTVESSTSEFLERVRARYVSTLALLPPGEFERGLAWLEAELPRRGARYAYEHEVTFVVASR